MCHDGSLIGWYQRAAKWGGGSSVGRVSDRHAADAGSIPRCGKGFFFQNQTSVQTLLRCPYTSVCSCMHLHLCECQVIDYGNTRTPNIHLRLGSATLSQLAFPGEGNPNFPWGKFHWSNTDVRKEVYFLVLFSRLSQSK